MLDINIEYFFKGGFDEMQPWIAELQNLIGVCEDDMVVLPILERSFKERGAVSEKMFAHKGTVEQ